jgi:hypothetical protein
VAANDKRTSLLTPEFITTVKGFIVLTLEALTWILRVVAIYNDVLEK